MHRSCFCRALILLAVALTAVSCASTQEQYVPVTKPSTWDRYRSADLASIISKEREAYKASAERLFVLNAAAAEQPYLVRATYTGEHRAISNGKRQAIAFYASSLRVHEAFRDAFVYEMLFQFGAESYWLPIQSQLLPHFQKELQRGNPVNLYIVLIGTVWESENSQWVFVVNEFQKPRGQKIDLTKP